MEVFYLSKLFIKLTKYKNYDPKEIAFIRLFNKDIATELTRNDLDFLKETVYKVSTALKEKTTTYVFKLLLSKRKVVMHYFLLHFCRLRFLLFIHLSYCNDLE